MKDFQGIVAVVTGAASGIGRALAEKCVREGVKVVLADVEEKALDQTNEELKALGGDVLAVRTDVSKAEDVEALAQQAFDTYGAVHLLFNNAGVGAGTTVWESSLADWQWVLGVNLWGGHLWHSLFCAPYASTKHRRPYCQYSLFRRAGSEFRSGHLQSDQAWCGHTF